MYFYLFCDVNQTRPLSGEGRFRSRDFRDVTSGSSSSLLSKYGLNRTDILLTFIVRVP